MLNRNLISLFSDPPVLGVQGEDTMPTAFVAGVETRFTCTVTYGTPNVVDYQDFTLAVESELGNRIDSFNGSVSRPGN